MHRLLELKDFCTDISTVRSDLNLTEREWKSLEQMLIPFKLCALKMKEMQAEDLSSADAFGHWLELELELKAIAQTELVKNLIKNIQERKKILMKNPIMLANLYLDPKFNCLLDAAQKNIAIEHLTTLYQRLDSLKQLMNLSEAEADDTEIDAVDISNSNVNATASMSVLETFLAEMHVEATTSTNCIDIRQIVAGFTPVKPTNLTAKVMEYWLEKQDHHPRQLMELALVVFAASATEVCVERNFSKLTFALNKYRHNLSDDELEKILLLSLNDA